MSEVYYFILDHRIGGPHVYVDSIRRALANDVKSMVLTTGNGPFTDLSLFNLRHWGNFLYLLEVLFNVVRILYLVALGAIKRDKAIFDIQGGANVAPIIAARLLGIPVVWHFHETLPKFAPLVNLGRWVLKGHPHRLVVVASKVKEVFSLEGAVVIPAPADTDYWSRKQTTSHAFGDWGWE